jgi:hypothetical protein
LILHQESAIRQYILAQDLTGSGGRVTQIDRQTAADPTEHDKKTVASRLLSVFQFKNRPP